MRGDLTTRRARALLAATAAGALIAGVPAQAEARHSSCLDAAHRAGVLDQSDRAAVFARGAFIYGCYSGRSRVWRLPRQRRDTPGDYEGTWSVVPESVAVAGRYAAYETGFSSVAQRGRFEGPYDQRSQVIVFDLVTGRVKARGTEHRTHTDVDSLVLKPNGSVAWIVAHYPDTVRGTPNAISVAKIDKTGPGEQVVDSFGAAQGGEAITLGSLALSVDRTRIYWARGTELRTAELR